MAFFDKLKGAADKAKEAAVKAAAAAKEKMEQQQQAAQQAEEARIAEQAEAKKNKWIALIEQELSGHPTDECFRYWEVLSYEDRDKFTTQLRQTYLHKLSESTNCDQGKGDCVWQNDKVFCSCGEDVDCPRKHYVKKSQKGILRSPEHIAYVKALSSFKRQSDSVDESKFRYFSSASVLINYRELLVDFFEAFLPRQTAGFLISKQAPDFLFDYGIGDDNPVMHIVYDIDEKSKGKISAHLNSLIGFWEKGIDLQQAFFNNQSLYDRDDQSFEYTVKVLDILSNPDKKSSYFKNPDKIDITQLFNADGTIKAAGVGGPKNGHYGDVIYNIVASWSEEEE